MPNDFHLRLPDDVVVRSTYLDNRQTATLVFKNSAPDPAQINSAQLRLLLSELNCNNSEFLFADTLYRVGNEDHDLVVSCAGSATAELDYIKHFILAKLKVVEFEGSSIEDLAFKLMEITNTTELLLTTAESTVASFRDKYPDVPDDFWKSFNETLSGDLVANSLNSITSLYVKFYSRAELIDLLVFYQSETGRKTIEITPQLSHEVVELTQQWAGVYADKIQLELVKANFG